MTRTKLLAAAGVIAALVIVAFFVFRQASPAPPDMPLPNSMAAIGDSITAAVAVSAEAAGGAPQHSWATGTEDSDAVASHYERLVEAGALDGSVFNNSVPGARMVDAMSQVESTVAQNVDYVVFLLGANDVCAPNIEAMTPVEDFRAQARAAIDRLATGLPQSAIYVVSIPNVYRLWEVEHTDLAATTIWSNAGICQSMLAIGLSEDQRRVALERNDTYNKILQEACARHATCRFDDNAVFEHEFGDDEIGPLDHFHPSEEGQAALAEISWEAGFWPDL